MVAGEIKITTSGGYPLLHIRDDEGHQSALKFDIEFNDSYGRMNGSHTNGEIILHRHSDDNSWELGIYYEGKWWITYTTWTDITIAYQAWSIYPYQIGIFRTSSSGVGAPVFIVSDENNHVWCDMGWSRDWILEA